MQHWIPWGRIKKEEFFRLPASCFREIIRYQGIVNLLLTEECLSDGGLLFPITIAFVAGRLLPW